MKSLSRLLKIVLLMMLLSWGVSFAEEGREYESDGLGASQAVEELSEDEVFLPEPDERPGEPGPGSMRPGPRGRFGREGEMGRGRGEGPGREMGKMGEGREDRRGRMADWRERFSQVNPEELMEFLAEHEPSLASRLESMREENPDGIYERMPALSRLYGPVMRQMEEDPEMAKVTLKQIRQRLKVEQLVRQLKQSKGEASEVREELTARVSDLYDVILEQESLRLVRWEERLEKVEQWKTKWKAAEDSKDDDDSTGSSEVGRKGKGQRGQKGGRQSGRSALRKGGSDRLAMMSKYMQNQRENLSYWRSHRDEVIEKRVDELLSQHPKFPWGR